MAAQAQNVYTSLPKKQGTISSSKAAQQVGAVVPPPPVSPQPKAPSMNAPTPTQTAAPAAPPPAKKSPKKILMIVGAIVALIIVIILGWNLLSGGGKKDEVTITWWGLWEDSTIVSPLIEEYQSQNPGIKINYVNQSKQDYRERLTSAFAKGDGPDIFRFHNTWVPMFISELDTIPASVMAPAEFAETFYPVASSDLTSGVGLVGIPLEYDGLALFVNEDIFATAGKSVPQTWDDLRQTALELTVKNEEGEIIQSGVALGRTENIDHWPEILSLMMIQNGVNLTNPVGPLAEGALEYYTLFSKSDAVWDETLPSSTTSFSGGKLAMYFAPSWRVFEIRQQNPDLNFKTYPVPQLPKATQGQQDIGFATYWVEGVWSRSEFTEEAWSFIKFLQTKSSLQALFQNASKLREFGEPYSRVDMADLLANHPVLSPIITQAPNAQSWYLASRTFDGPTGINSLLISYFEDAVNAVNDNQRADDALETLASGISQVLSQYGLTRIR